MNKHTDGPWALDLGEVTGTFVVYQDGSQDAIATVWDNYSEKENDANARLLAAAPDLLAALTELETWWANWMPDDALGQGGHDALVMARAALAKAQS